MEFYILSCLKFHGFLLKHMGNFVPPFLPLTLPQARSIKLISIQMSFDTYAFFHNNKTYLNTISFLLCYFLPVNFIYTFYPQKLALTSPTSGGRSV
jgi:hypothetical protein